MSTWTTVNVVTENTQSDVGSTSNWLQMFCMALLALVCRICDCSLSYSRSRLNDRLCCRCAAMHVFVRGAVAALETNPAPAGRSWPVSGIFRGRVPCMPAQCICRLPGMNRFRFSLLRRHHLPAIRPLFTLRMESRVPTRGRLKPGNMRSMKWMKAVFPLSRGPSGRFFSRKSGMSISRSAAAFTT